MKFTLYTADCQGREKNTLYPHQVSVDSAEKLKEAAAFDHVGAAFDESRRSLANFLLSDVSVMDCDNDHSDNPSDWIMPDQYADIFPDVSYVVVPSRSDGKVKGGKSARPRHHVYFPHKQMSDAKEEALLKQKIYELMPYFDSNALDAARFIYGHSVDDVLWHEGTKTIDEFLEESDFSAMDRDSRSIEEGTRNATMSRLAGRIIKRYGNTEEARQIYAERSKLCRPPLPQEELAAIWKSAVKFGERISKEAGYIPPERYNTTLKPDDYTDMGQAKVVYREYKDRLAYTDATDFLCYDGVRWVESRQMAVGVIEDLVDRQLDEAVAQVLTAKKALMAAGIGESLINEGGRALDKAVTDASLKAWWEYRSAKSYQAFVMKRRDIRYILSALQTAKPMVLKDIREFDTQEFLLNTPGSTYDLRLGMDGYREHDAADGITRVTSVSPDDTHEELWENCVAELFLGDMELIDYVQQIVGLAAIGKVYQESLIIAYGDGCNGKSTFWNAIAKVMGNYSGALSAEALTFGCKRNVKPEMAELKGKRLVIAAEMDEGVRLKTSLVKQLCSTDEVSAEKKYKDPFKYSPTHTIVLYTNHLPKVGARDDGTWRRLIVIPFAAKIQGKADIKNYADYLVTHAGGAILKWIIEGARKAIASNFTFKIPYAVEEAVEKYRVSNDWLMPFLDDCCEADKTLTERSGELYRQYREYAQRNGDFVRGTADFYSALNTAGFQRKKTKAGILVWGLRLKSDFIN